MSSFHIVQHSIPCQHIREYPRALGNSQNDVPHLAVKQYIPKDNPNPQAGDVTIIAAHANGFPKELYEPLWDDLHARAQSQGFRIRAIWIADVSQQGQSGVMNEKLLGNDPSWSDHPRDLLHMINLKRAEMPRPLFGIGHSMGGNNLVNLALIHPRLLEGLILIDPVMTALSSADPSGRQGVAHLSTFRRDLWPSREDAIKRFSSNPFYQAWDSRVLDRWFQYGIRDTPTVLQPDGPPKVTLTTPVVHEVATFLRPNFEGYGVNGKAINRKTHADLNAQIPPVYPFYRAEGIQTYLRLPELRPAVLYVFGGLSDVGTPEACAAKMRDTGVGVGGSGGAAEGRVSSVTFEDIGHLIAMEVPTRTADHASKWLGKEAERWRQDEAEYQRVWVAKSLKEKQSLDPQWKKMLGGPPTRAKPNAPKL